MPENQRDGADSELYSQYFRQGLKRQRLNTIGFVSPDNVNPSYSIVLQGVEERAATLRYNVILCNSNEDVEREKTLLQVLLGKHVDGVILCPAYHPQANPNIKIFATGENALPAH